MRTLSAMPDHKRKRIAQETLEIFAPLANRLGIYQIKRELEDLSFKYLDPEKYQTIAKELDAHQENVNKYIKRIAADLEQTLQSAGIKATLSWRTKHIYSISRKMQRKEADLNDIYDIKALRIIVPEVKDCYAALGVVHTKWRPIPGEFDDYIAAAKDNGYQSLHTAVMDNNGEQFEVQIRTEEMHQQAELGIAAHWRYKDNSRPDEALDRKIATMRQAMKWQEELFDASEVENPHDFVNALKSDVIEERVYVFTPKGDIKDLPLGSTPIDFAYYIHTEVGHKCRGAKVNGKLVGLDYQLANGDKVEILTAKRGGPSRDWLNENLGYVKTSRARSKIKYWFKRQNYQESVVQGRSLLERELKRLNLNGLNTEELSEICGYNTIDDFLAAVGYNDLPIQQVIRKVLEFLAGDKKPEEELIVTTVPLPAAAPARTDSVHVKGMANLLTHLGNCCRPVPGDPIIGYITRGRGVTVHRYDCPNALKVVDRERMIEVSWGVEETKTYGVDIIIRAYDRPGLVRDISHVIANEQVNIQNLDVMTRRKNNTAELLVTLEISALTHLIKLMDKIEQLPNIIYVRRRG
jgi:GTP pyrophosphokinase